MKPYKHWTNNELKYRLIQTVFRVSKDNDFAELWVDLIHEAFKSNEWEIKSQYDGCTLVQDHLHPCPACFVHDYMCQTGRGGIMCDRIFKHCMKNEGMKKWRINVRWFAVRCYFICFSFWKFVHLRELKKPSKSMVEINKYITK